MILLILLFSLILRLISLNQSLWLDEGINVLAVKNYSLSFLLTDYLKADFHPPLFFIFLWGWTKIFGYSEIAVRVPSVVFGVLAVYIIYLIGKKLVNQKLGFIAALILGINPLHIYYSQEARMYALAALAVSLNLFYFIKLVRGEKKSFSLGYFLSSLLILGSDYLAYFIFPAQLMYLIFLRSKITFKIWVLSFLPSLLFFVFWLPFIFKQLNVGTNAVSNIPKWGEVVGSFGSKPVILTFVKFIIGRIDYPDKIIYALIFLPIGIFFIFLIATAFIKSSKFVRNLLVTLLVLPIVSVSLVSFFIPVYSYFRLLYLVVPFILLVSLGLIFFKNRLFKILLTAVVVIELGSSLIYLFNPLFQRENWRGAVEFIKKTPATRIVLLESDGIFSPYEYYANGSINTIPALKKFPANSKADVVDLNEKLKGENEVLLMDYLVDISDSNRQVKKKLQEVGFSPGEIYNFNGVGFIYKYHR